MPRLTPSSIIGSTALAFSRTWREADATGLVLGRMATRIAIVLMGKHKPIYDQQSDLPFLFSSSSAPSHPLLLLITLSSLLYLSSQDDCGDYVVVTNARSIVVTGKKSDQKLYRHHSGFPGGLKEIPYKTLMEKKPEEIIRRAVSGMLPKNRLRAKRMERLFIYPDHVHPYEENFMKDHAEEFRVAFGAVGKEGREEKR